jgi:cytochrome c oxidase subunit IV
MTRISPELMNRIPSELRERLRRPFIVFVVSLALLLVNGLLGVFAPYGHVWVAEVLIAGTMVVILLLFSMEVTKEPPIVRLFSGLGFFWVAILFSLTMIDYLTR